MPVELRDIGHRHPGTGWLFRGLTTRCPSGTITAIAGPSGSGKSTLLSILGGALTPTEGAVVPDGVEVAWVFQQPVGLSFRTALDNVALPLVSAGASRRDADRTARELLGSVGLARVAEQPFRLLSGGEMQRVGLVRAIAQRCPLILADEPTAQLDRGSASIVVDSLGSVASHGAAVVIATHDVAVMESADTILELGRR